MTVADVRPAITNRSIMTDKNTGVAAALAEPRNRLVGTAWLAGSAAWLVAAAVGAAARDDSTRFYAAESVWLVAQLLLLAALIGLRSLRPDGGRRLGRFGFGLAVLGRLVFVAAEVIALVDGAESEALLPLGAVLTALGMVMVGGSTIRAGVWNDWRRFTPLAVGVYPFLFMFPLVATGGSPDLSVALWALPTSALGVAVLGMATVPVRVDETEPSGRTASA